MVKTQAPPAEGVCRLTLLAHSGGPQGLPKLQELIQLGPELDKATLKLRVAALSARLGLVQMPSRRKNGCRNPKTQVHRCMFCNGSEGKPGNRRPACQLYSDEIFSQGLYSNCADFLRRSLR